MKEKVTLPVTGDMVCIQYELEVIDTIEGAKGSYGEPEEPDEQLCSASLVNVTLFGVDFTDRVDIDTQPEEDFFSDLYEKITEVLEELV